MFHPAEALQACFLVAASTVLLINSIPAFSSRYVSYGSRTASPSKHNRAQDQSGDAKPGAPPTVFPSAFVCWILDTVAAIKVPHAWFTHFYIVSVASSIFWGVQIFTQGSYLKGIGELDGCRNGREGMSPDQTILASALMSVQGTRRLLESTKTGASSKSSMFIAHWLLGILFYLAMGVAIWIEGIGTKRLVQLFVTDASIGRSGFIEVADFAFVDEDALVSPEFAVQRLTWSLPFLRTMLWLPVFIIASGIQHDCHQYLSSLPKYTLPTLPMFQELICPHYTAECVIYLSLAFLAAPKGAIVNRTILASFVFVSVNLSVTATKTKKWYAEKFSKKAVASRWIIVPYLY